VSINFVDQANAANHYTTPPPSTDPNLKGSLRHFKPEKLVLNKVLGGQVVIVTISLVPHPT